MHRIRSNRARLAAFIALAVTAAKVPPANAQVVSLTVGLNTSCLYGVPN